MIFRKTKMNLLKAKEKHWEEEAAYLIKAADLKRKQKEVENYGKSKISTSKLLIVFLFANCTVIEIFTGWAMVKMLQVAMIYGSSLDFTPLVALIGAVVGEVVGYGVYCLKATKENTANGINYELAMRDAAPSAPSENAVG